MVSINANAAAARLPALWLRSSNLAGVESLLQTALHLEPVVAAILASRGFSQAEAVQEFLSPELHKLHDPFDMRDMEHAAVRIWEAIRSREPILLYGDYDVDGTCSIVILKKTIEILGGLADFHIPHRLKDGYGMRSEVVGRAAETGVRLIVSVDTGIRANEVVQHANALGIDVIVTDHHLPDKALPPALAVLNPNRPDCSYPNKNLCGAGVALKLVQALLSKSGMPEGRCAALLDSFLKPVAIATVADIVPLTCENRVIVKRGLSGLKQVRNLGLRALLDVAGLGDGECPSAHQVAFRLAPRINAAGRMATARDVVELFLTDDADRAQHLAEQLDLLNRERQRVETEIIESIVEQCNNCQTDLTGSAMVFAGSGWHLGVLGIVASRLVERFNRPVFVLSDAPATDENGQSCLSGSGRSIPAFHLLEALESMPELFTKFGGHRQAAGLSLRASDVETFRQRFHLFAADKLTAEDFRPRHNVDAQIALADLTERCVRQVLSLGPFGFGNPAPILCCADVQVAGPPRLIGSGKHFSVPLRQNGRTLFCKAWNFGDRIDSFQPGSALDVLLQIEDDPLSRKRGYGSWCLSLKDFKAKEQKA
ncbi:MAG: single-stranded-DNA-specific exonuclease RecJ [Acidobacteriota bacterium]|nr:single-stranded-DNA-specific exonuclease RecJ [Acidobacteriota bacterium]